MRLNFRQGIAKYQTDQFGTPQYLDLAPSHKHVGVVVAESPILVSFAHRDTDYLIEETLRIEHAWNVTDVTYPVWMYWDISLVNAQVSRGITKVRPIVSPIAPTAPLLDTHWFDLTENVMKLWSGAKWNECLRVFAGTFVNGRIDPYPIGSQVGISDVPNDAGYLLLDPFQMPLRFKPVGEPSSWYGRFLTSESWITVANRGGMLSKMDSGNFPVIATEPIPKFSLVQMKPDRGIELARHTDHTARVNGIVMEDMYKSDVSDLFCHGFIANDDWNWESSDINKPLFCGPTGEIVTEPPSNGVYQQVGFVYDNNAIFVDLMPVIILDEIVDLAHDSSVTQSPIADFSVSVVEGIAPLTVEFTSLSEDAANYEWDFQNNDSWDAVGEQVKYKFDSPGAYTIKHRVSNQFGVNTKIVPNLIKVRPATSQILVPNLKVQLLNAAPLKIGTTFKFRIFVENVGNGIGENISTLLQFLTDTGVDVVVINSGSGTIAKSGRGSTADPKITTISFPDASLESLQVISYEIELKIASYAKTISFTGISTVANEAEIGDNKAVLQLPIKF
jgi:PKD repeat protein